LDNGSEVNDWTYPLRLFAISGGYKNKQNALRNWTRNYVEWFKFDVFTTNDLGHYCQILYLCPKYTVGFKSFLTRSEFGKNGRFLGTGP
jgi:hypothetical protein